MAHNRYEMSRARERCRQFTYKQHNIQLHLHMACFAGSLLYNSIIVQLYNCTVVCLENANSPTCIAYVAQITY